MTVITPSRPAQAVRVAERVLSARAGSAVTLADPIDLGGSGRTSVVRARVAQNPLSLDRSLVLKVFPADAHDGAFARELASYKYATALPSDSRPGPQLIASDTAARLLVLSDLGDGRSMVELLGSTDWSDTSHAISAWGQALGRMHAATVGGEADFAALLRHGPGHETVEAVRVPAGAAVQVAADLIAAAVGVRLHAEVLEMLHQCPHLFSDGDHRAFSPSDVGPPNILINDDGVQFMDYEWGGFRDATLDIAYALVTFVPELAPRWMARRDELETALIDAWRSEIQAIWPALVHDGQMHRKVLAARTLWVWLSTAWMLDPDLDVDQRTHGLAVRSNDPAVLVARWRDLSAAGRRIGLVGMGDSCAEVADALDAAWHR
ncbi:hypothetical protein [Williamsia sp. CHRR-6]|uniref:hypothetical protein n=1 Tax=Williamsia sp. CHRR-6 TaxID=2835871 RepID=UPI001BDA63F9|nr:hypothetical protein [Williamsia sp. CHRR-6]MBT0567996.1 hypothetical protein [Williamsia sp. CHRR-6]